MGEFYVSEQFNCVAINGGLTDAWISILGWMNIKHECVDVQIFVLIMACWWPHTELPPCHPILNSNYCNSVEARASVEFIHWYPILEREPQNNNQCLVKVFVGLHEVRGQPRFETRSLYHFMFKGEGGVVHGKMASAHFMCVTLLGNPLANKQLIYFRFNKLSDIQLQSTIYCPIYYFTQMSFIYLVYDTVKNLYISKSSQISSMSKK